MPRNAAVEAHHFEALGTSCSLFGVGVSRTDLVGGELWVRKLGGDLYAAGQGPGGGGWPVGFGGKTVMLRDQGAATSSVRKRRWGALHHLIDPRTGLPSNSGLEEVSVVAATACDAEIVAKTAPLLGSGVATAFSAAHAPAWRVSSSPLTTSSACFRPSRTYARPLRDPSPCSNAKCS